MGNVRKQISNNAKKIRYSFISIDFSVIQGYSKFVPIKEIIQLYYHREEPERNILCKAENEPKEAKSQAPDSEEVAAGEYAHTYQDAD